MSMLDQHAKMGARFFLVHSGAYVHAALSSANAAHKGQGMMWGCQLLYGQDLAGCGGSGPQPCVRS